MTTTTRPTLLAEATDTFETLWAAPHSNRGRLTLDERGFVDIAGETHETITVLDVVRIGGLGIVLTLHRKGGTHWAGRGVRRGHRASTRTVVIAWDNAPGRYRYVDIGRGTLYANDADRAESTTKIARLLNAAQDAH